MTSKHTPGEWLIATTHTPGQPTAISAPFSLSGKIMPFIAFATDTGNKEEKKANAHLIAAAPELLQVAKDCAAYLPVVIAREKEILADMLGHYEPDPACANYAAVLECQNRIADMQAKLDRVNAVIAKTEGRNE